MVSVMDPYSRVLGSLDRSHITHHKNNLHDKHNCLNSNSCYDMHSELSYNVGISVWGKKICDIITFHAHSLC
jgi:hypothetical protein